MDESFQLRTPRLPCERRLAPLAHDMLSAALAARQSASPTASAQARAVEAAAPPEGEPLIALLLAGMDWKKAATDQHGCFNRAESKRRGNEA